MILSESLVSERVYLRALNLSDCNENYLKWLNDREVNKYLETRFVVQTKDLISAFVQSVNASSDSYLMGIFAGGGVHIGNIKIGPIHPVYRFADISYFIGDRDFWGKGCASTAIKLITAFGFEKLNLNRIQAGVHGTNAGSQRALEKCGFKKEAVLRKKIYYNSDDGIIWDDHLYYGILKNEYIAE